MQMAPSCREGVIRFREKKWGNAPFLVLSETFAGAQTLFALDRKSQEPRRQAAQMVYLPGTSR
jgi:hypothetical protein